MDWVGFAFIIILVILVAPVLAVTALARVSGLEQKTQELTREVAELRRRVTQQASVGPAAAPPASASQPEAVRPPPVASAPSPGFTAAPEPPRAAAPPPPEPQAAEPAAARTSWAQRSTSIERMIAANWLVWLGAAALALGGIFLVRFAWEQGYFGPEARTIAATFAGAAMIAGSEWLRRRIPADAEGQIGFAPLAVAAAGAVTLYGAAYAAGPLYHLVSPELTLVAYIAASVIAVGLAMRHGPILAALGLAGGYIAPLLVGEGAPDPVMLLAYAFAVTLAALVLVRAFDWRRIVWVALIGAGLWMMLGVTMNGLANGPIAVAVYALALLAAATALAWSDADRLVPVQTMSGGRIIAYPTQTVAAAYGFWIVSGLGLLSAHVAADAFAGDLAMWSLAVYAAAAVFVGWRKLAFQTVPLFGAAAVLLGLLATDARPMMQLTERIIVGVQVPADPGAVNARFLAFAWVGAAVAGLGGWFAMRRMGQGRTIMALVSAFTPLGLLLIAFDRIGGFSQHFTWGLSGALLTLLNLAALEGLRRAAGGLDAAKGAAASYALGAFAASMFGVGASLGEMWMTMLIALHLPAIAIIDRRFNLQALRLSASIAAMVALARLLWPDEIASYAVSATPILNELTLLYGVSLLCFWAAARLFAANLKSAEAPLPQALDVGAIVILTALVAVQIRHVASGGNLASTNVDLIEVGAYAMAFISLAIGLVTRLGAQARPWLALASHAVYGLAVIVAVLGLGLLFNPLLAGDKGLSLDGPPLVNLLASSYLPSAILFAIHAVLSRRLGNVWAAQLSRFIALALLFLYVTLEVRNAFHVELSLARGAVGEVESYTYSIVWLLFAVATLVAGLVRKQIAIRHAAMAVLALSVGKVFLMDMSALTGILRGASFIGLGAALIAIAYLYQRLVFRRVET